MSIDYANSSAVAHGPKSLLFKEYEFSGRTTARLPMPRHIHFSADIVTWDICHLAAPGVFF